MARPKKKAKTVRVALTLSLTVGQDDDLIAFFDRLDQGERAAGVITAMRSGGMLKATAGCDDLDEDKLLDSFWDLAE